jgi:hypothetical protein
VVTAALRGGVRHVHQALTAAGWGSFSVSQGVWAAAEHDGVSAGFDNDPTATESETSVTDLLYFLAGACVAVPGPASIALGGGSQVGGGPDAGPPPGDVSAGDSLPPVRVPTAWARPPSRRWRPGTRRQVRQRPQTDGAQFVGADEPDTRHSGLSSPHAKSG